MFYKKAKRVLAGICAFTLILSGIGENACVAMAAETTQTVIETEQETEEAKEETDNYVEQTDSESSVENSIEETSAENNETEQETESSEADKTETEIETESSQEITTESETESVIPTETETVEENITESETEDAIEVTEEVVDNDLEDDIITNPGGLQYKFDESEGIITIVAAQRTILNNVLVSDSNKENIKHVKFEEGSQITVVDALAFYGCSNLLSVDFSNCNELTRIGENAFDGCVNLSEVKFSNNLQFIESSAFKGCESLTEVTLTEGLISVKSKAFINCSSLSKVVIKTNNISNTTQDKKIDEIFSGCAIETIEFSNNITVVPTVLFRGAGFKESANIVIPNYIQEIGEYAFEGSSLKNITFEDEEGKKSKLASIAMSAFENCSVLERVVFPESLKIIEETAFKKCTSLATVEIPNTVTSLGDSAFEECTSISQLKLSNATTTLGKNVFKKCSSLTKVEIPSGLTLISEGEFSECINLNELTIANTVKSIGVSAFEDCTSITSLEIPNSVEEIGKRAFCGCISLDEPKLSDNITKLSESVFESCSSLRKITIPEKVTVIEKQAFRYCKLLNPLKLPQAITTIDERAFEGCNSISELEIPENVTTLGKGAFNGCIGIGTLKISSLKITSCKEGIFANCYIKNVEFPEGITEIPNLLFNQAQFVTNTTITIPNTVTRIGVNAFSGDEEKGNNIIAFAFEEDSQLKVIDSNAFQFNSAIKSFEIPESTTIIGASAFADCRKIEEITIPENITSIGASAFSGCIVLSTINYNAIAATTSVKNKENAIFKDCNIKKITIGDKVTILPAYLFYGANFSDNQDGATVFVDLTVPASVEEIGEYTFANISNIKTVNFKDGSVLTKLGAFAFSSCIGLETCMIPDTVTSIGNSAFSGCLKLTKTNIPKNIRIIGDSAFSGCIGLDEIIIPQGAETIGASAFSNCTKLEKVQIPKSIKEIGMGAFNDCSKAVFYVFKGSFADLWLIDSGINEDRISYLEDLEDKEIITENGVSYMYGDTLGSIIIVAEQSSIPANAFKNNTKIKSVTFEEGSELRFIDASAFYNCTSLISIDFTNCKSLTDIKKQAFYGCTTLKNVVFSKTLQYIYENAFYNCSSLEEITLTTGLIEIKKEAFKNCLKLSSIIIEANNISCVSSGNIFSGCGIKTISFTSNNTVVPAGLFKGAKFDETADIVIPKHIQEIGASAFAGSNLSKITFEGIDNNSCMLSSIAEAAFSGCTKLADISLPESLKTIEPKAFSSCTSLTKLTIPNTVTKLGNSAFSDCTGIISLQLSNATSDLGTEIFKNCSSLETVEIPKGIKLISEGEFSGCKNLEKLTISETVTSIGASAFFECVSLNNLIIPNSVTEIGNSAFSKCLALDNPTLSNELTKLSANIFDNCTSMQTIIIPNKVTEIGDNAFLNCSKLKNLTLSNNLEKIGINAFSDCILLTSVNLPESLIQIGKKAFSGCTSLIGIVIPERVTTIDEGAFSGCIKFNTVTINSKNIVKCGKGIFTNCYLSEVKFVDGIEEIPENLFSQAGFITTKGVTIPATVKKIGASAFAGTNNVVNNVSYISFEKDSVLNEIGEGAFQYCTAIENFEIPNSTTIIGKNAFLECIKLKEIKIPENITSIGSAAFSGCEVLTTVYYNAIAATTTITKPDNKDKDAIFKDCNIKTIAIGDKVIILPAYLFYGAKFAENQDEAAVFVDLLVPEAVEKIGEYAFANISNIRTITFEDGSMFTDLGKYAFNSCIALEKCILPNTVTEIGMGAFYGCTKLKEFEIPTSLTTLGSYAFYQCSSIESYVIPRDTVAILDHTFYGNKSLTTVVFEGLNIAEIGDNAFGGCEKLKEINIPQGTTSIGMNAFYGCTELGTVRIPDSVNEIGEGTFDNCPNVMFYVVNGSYAYEWLVENGFKDKIKNMLTITYELNGGTNDIRNIGGFLEGDVFTFFAATKPGYDFKGWFLEESLETQVTDLTGQTTDFTLYAKWELATYKITYELDGGTNSEQNPETFTIESKKINLQNPKKAGYSFKGWYKDSEFKTRISNIAAGSTGDITLYAKWEAITYVIKFNANGGAGEKEEIQVIADEAFTIPGSDIFTKEGYVLTGFSTTANGKGEIFKPGESVSAIVESSNKMCVVILYAQWKKFMPNTVEAPVADYESGSELHAGTKITLTTKTKGASIYYTIDGSAPTTSSLLYTDGIIINEPTNLRVFAVKDGFNESVEVVYSYTIIDESSFWGDITDEDKALYEDATKVPDGIWVAGVQDAVYTGSSIKFELRVYDYKTLLTEKKDYTVKYSNNKKAATKTASKAPVITITAKGDYKGTVKVKFNILPVDISGNEFAAENMYASINGKIQKPIPKLTFGKTKLKNKRDFVVSYPDNPNGFITEGDYKITLTGVGNFTGTRTVDFELKNCTLITKTKVSKIQALNYTGEALTPAVTVTYKGATLVKDTDYIVNYQNNVDAGTASVVITGINNYRGVKTVNFKINPVAQLKKAQITFNKTSVAYTGEAIEFNTGVEPVVETVSYAGMTLVRGEDYVIDSYSKNINKGTATVAFKGIGGYSGVVKKKFKITAASIANAELKFLDASGNIIEGEAEYPYIKGGCKPNILVTYNGKKLVSGTDYTIKYTDNTKQGYASLTLKGKKNFNNELNASFIIGKQDISKLSINVDDLELQSQSTEPISYLSVPVLKDLNGKVLKSGVDYESKVLYTYAIECPIRRNNKNIRVEAGEEVQASDVIPAKTVIRATVNGKGNYEGSISENYVIVSKNISRAVVTVKTQNYTGKAVTPGKSDITVLIDEYKLKDSEYEIIGYEKNISKGTGIVILRGTGNYGGTVKAKFSIKQKNFSLASFINEFFS